MPIKIDNNLSCHPKKDLIAIDLLKFFFAICVLFLHTHWLHNLIDESFGGRVTYFFCMNAVPFFFTAGGFFIIKKINNNLTTKENISMVKPILRYWRKMALLYIFWCISRYICLLMCGMPFQSSFANFLEWFFLIGYDVYWYLWSIIGFTPFFIAFITYYYFNRRRPSDFLWLISIISILLMLLNGCENILLPNYLLPIKWLYYIQSHVCCISMILFGFIFFLLGGYLAMTKASSGLLSSICIIMVGYLLFYWPDSVSYFKVGLLGNILSAYGIFTLALKWRPRISHRISFTIRKMSAWIYFTHIFIISFYGAFYGKIYGAPLEKSATTTLIIFFLCIMSAFLCTQISKIKYFKWMNKLI